MLWANHNVFKACVGRTTSGVVGCDHESNIIMSKVGAHCSSIHFHEMKNILDHDDQQNDFILV